MPRRTCGPPSSGVAIRLRGDAPGLPARSGDPAGPPPAILRNAARPGPAASIP
jgi:hypothetical protein